MKLAHLKIKGDEEDPSDSTAKDADKYPEGMKIRLGHHEMNKIGLEETPTPGDKFHVEGHAVVTHAHQHPTDPEDRHVEMQFTHAGAEAKAEQKPEKSLREEIGAAHKQAKPIVPREERLAKKQEAGKDAGEKRTHPTEPAHGRAVGA